MDATPVEPPPNPAPLQAPTPATLPQPPARPASGHRLRAGQLTNGWNLVFWITWAGIALGFAGVWFSSRTTGFATWWLGPEADPKLLPVNLLPFVAPIALATMGYTDQRHLPRWGVLGALATAAIATGDLLIDMPRYAVVEFCFAAGGLLVSLASTVGVLRPVQSVASGTYVEGSDVPAHG